jgi:hypothetical protein
MRRLIALWPLGLLPLAVIVVLTTRVGSSADLRISQAQRDLSVLDHALHAYKCKHGDFPNEADGLAALNGQGGEVARIAKDPWGNAYLYRHAAGAKTYLVYSPGRDHRDDAGSGDDVILGHKNYRCVGYGLNCAPASLQVVAWMALALAGLSLAVGIISAGVVLVRLVRRPTRRWRGE